MTIFTDTMTVYNHYIDENGDDKWVRHVINHIQWRNMIVQAANSDGIITATRSNSITIDFSHNKQQNFLTAAEYERTGQYTKHWTLNAEDDMDVLVQGECDVEITDEYTITNLIKDYGAVTIKSVADNRNRRLLQNIKVVAQ